MNISALIAQLEALRKEHGDEIPCVSTDMWTAIKPPVVRPAFPFVNDRGDFVGNNETPQGPGAHKVKVLFL